MARPRSEAARGKMLDATIELVFDCGVRGVTVNEVARRSGVARTTIYRHFPTRNELLVAALDGALPVPGTPDTGTLRRDLVEFVASVLPIFKDPGLRMVFLDITATATRDPGLHALQRGLAQSRNRPLRAIYENARDRAEIPSEVTYAQAFEIVEGPLIVRAMTNPDALDGFDVEAEVDRMIRLLSV